MRIAASKASRNPATFMTVSMAGGQAMLAAGFSKSPNGITSSTISRSARRW
jgi:hypothetical protein